MLCVWTHAQLIGERLEAAHHRFLRIKSRPSRQSPIKTQPNDARRKKILFDPFAIQFNLLNCCAQSCLIFRIPAYFLDLQTPPNVSQRRDYGVAPIACFRQKRAPRRFVKGQFAIPRAPTGEEKQIYIETMLVLQA